jgi:epoxyqueuosine reductase
LNSQLRQSFSKDEFHSIILSNGFPVWGITKAIVPDEDQQNILSWVKNKYHGEMSWFEKNMELRLEFKNLGFTPLSIFVFLVPYPDEELPGLPFHFARYALGEDYHRVIREKIQPIMEYLRLSYPEGKFRHSVDSLPIPEKILAREAGLGWIGNNTLLINKELGSYFFITTILSSIEFDLKTIDFSNTNHCGSCKNCIDSCPTNAIISPGRIDSRLCISHNTIESKRTDHEKGKNHNWLFGCDICQEVCPWNDKSSKKFRKSLEYNPWKEWSPLPIFKKSMDEWGNLNEEEFQDTFKNSSVSRIDYNQFIRNIKSL